MRHRLDQLPHLLVRCMSGDKKKETKFRGYLLDGRNTRPARIQRRTAYRRIEEKMMTELNRNTAVYNLLLIFFSFALSPFLIAVRPPGSILIGFEFFLFFQIDKRKRK